MRAFTILLPITFPVFRSTSSRTVSGSRCTTYLCAREPSARELVVNLTNLLESALSLSTLKQYQQAWAVFTRFHATYFHSVYPSLPLTSATLTLFVSYLHACQLGPATVTSYLPAISYVHKLRGVSVPTKTFVIQKLLTAVYRSRFADIRLPITRSILHQLLGSLQHTNSSTSQHTTLSAMFLVAFYGFFRVGELTTKSQNSSSQVIQYSNVSFRTNSADICGVKITLTRFKHNTKNRPHDIIIDREDSLPFCPVKSLLAYLRPRGHSNGPLFCTFDGSPITTRYFNSELRRCLIFRGLDTSRYKSHSIRIGAVCLAADQGYSDAQIRALGRWQSDAFKVYIRPVALHANYT